MKVSVAAAEGGGGGGSSWSLFGYEVNESWEGRKEGRKEGWDPFSTALSLARRRAEVKGGKRSAAAAEREEERDEVQRLRPRLLQGRSDGRTEDAVFGLGGPRRLWLWLWVERAEGDRGSE